MAEGRGDVADLVALVNWLIGMLPETEEQSIDDRAEQLVALLAELNPVLVLVRTGERRHASENLQRPEQTQQVMG